MRHQHVNADGAGKPYDDDNEAKHRIRRVGQDVDEARERLWQVGKEGSRSEADSDQLVEEKDQSESRQNLVHVITPVKMANQQEFKQKPAGECDRNGQHDADKEIACQRCQAGRGIGADHYLRAMRQKDEIHDAEYQRQTGRNQEKHNARLKAVEHLLEQKRDCH